MDGREASERSPGEKAEKARRARFVGVVLLAFAVLMWVLAPAVFLLPLQTARKFWMATALAVVGEGAFWVSAFVLGREVARQYHRFLDPRPWLRRSLRRKSR